MSQPATASPTRTRRLAKPFPRVLDFGIASAAAVTGWRPPCHRRLSKPVWPLYLSQPPSCNALRPADFNGCGHPEAAGPPFVLVRAWHARADGPTHQQVRHQLSLRCSVSPTSTVMAQGMSRTERPCAITSNFSPQRPCRIPRRGRRGVPHGPKKLGSRWSIAAVSTLPSD